MDELHSSGSPAEDDAELVDAARAGVRSALEQLIRRYNQQLYRIARAHLGSDDEAEDLTQQAWLSIVSNLNQWSGRGTFTAWAATIVVNACRARHRGVRAQDPHDDEVDPRQRQTRRAIGTRCERCWSTPSTSSPPPFGSSS